MATDLPPITGSLNSVAPAQTESVTARSRVNLSVLHLSSASRFSRAVQDLEAEHAVKRLGGFCDEVFAHATASVCWP